MKHSDSFRNISLWLLVLMPIALLVPNIALDFTEIHYSSLTRACNILIPGGAYILLMSAWRRNTITALCLLPVMVICAFQIVLLFLYGEAVIAIDMFLNVVTTNVSEATELLSNLSTAIIVVCVIYLPLLVLAIMGTVRGSRLSHRSRIAGLIAGAALAAAGVVCALINTDYRPLRTLFPLNAFSNIHTAWQRTVLAREYFDASADFSFHAQTTHPDSTAEVYILVIGETSRADNWELFSGSAATNPKLKDREGLITFPRTLSESNTTHKSVPLMLSHLDSRSFGDSIYSVRGIMDAFGEAGFRTSWLSNQQRNGQLIDFFGERADDVVFLNDDGNHHLDGELLPLLKDRLDSIQTPAFVALHTYGSHFNYKERYPAGFGPYNDQGSLQANPHHQQALLDAYDNSIVYIDAVLDSVISMAESLKRPAAVMYIADHGEDIFDDDRKRFLHASPTPTYWQLHVPLLLWTSKEYEAAHPENVRNARVNSHKRVSGSRSTFHTLLTLAGITSDKLDTHAALTDGVYTEPEHLYLNDYNEAVSLEQSGLRDEDFRQIQNHGL